MRWPVKKMVDNGARRVNVAVVCPFEAWRRTDTTGAAPPKKTEQMMCGQISVQIVDFGVDMLSGRGTVDNLRCCQHTVRDI